MAVSGDSQRWVAIGAYELKKCYQTNMMVATLTVTLFTAVLVALGNVVGHLNGKVTPAEDGYGGFIYTFDATTVLPPPLVEDQLAEDGGGVQAPVEGSVLVEGVDDALIDVESSLLTRLQRRQLLPGAPARGGGRFARYSVLDKPYKVEEDTFVAVQKLPILLRQVSPEYPRLARKMGTEASVTVSVLIGTDGTVKNAIVAQASGLDAGFEEAALAAAYSTIWEPAEQNGQPVEIWVAYKVLFRLRG
jgi:TonB family protein